VRAVPLTVREARGADEIAAAGAVALAAYEAADLLAPESTYRETLKDAAARAAGALLLVAVEDDRVVGTATYVAGPGPMHEISAPDEAEFRMLAVAPEAAGRGVGAALVAELVSRARADGAVRLVCSSQRAMTTAHRLYARAGFVRDPARDWSPVPGVDLLAFALDL
jgi:GNAT superfamily N-acetyltransferase